VDGLARQLVSFDAQVSDEIAEHLLARAERLDARRDRGDLAAAGRARRFRALAGLIQRELLIRTAMHDCRTQGRTWELLRLTRMPAVRIEVGYLSNMGDLRRLMDPAFRDVVAEGILVAVKRLYLLGQDDQPTGTFTFGDVLARELERDQAKAI